MERFGIQARLIGRVGAIATIESITPPRDRMRIVSGRTEIEIDDATGSIVVVAEAGGRIHFDARRDPERLGRLFRILLPERDWVAHHADSQATRPTVVQEASGKVTLRFADLASPRGPAGVEAEVAIEPAPNDEVHFTLSLTNHRDGDLTDVMFPWLAGWVAGPSGPDHLLLGGVRDVDPGSYPRTDRDTVGRWHQRDFWAYPRDLYCPWFDLSTRGGGIGVLSYQTEPSILGVFVENLAGYEPGQDLSVGLAHFPRLRRGESWRSPVVAVVAHKGDWRATADRYSTWVDGWFRSPPTPVWARRAIGVQNVLFRVQDGTRFHRFNEIPELARAGLAHGVPHLTVWDLGIMGPVPEFMTPWVPFSERDRTELVTGLAAARGMGAHLSLVQNYRIAWPGSEFYRDVASRELALRYDGTPYVEEFLPSQWHPAFEAAHVGTMTYVLDPRVDGYRERVLRKVAETLALGFDSVHWDQPHMHWPSYRDDVPGQPYGVHSATVGLLLEVRRLVHDRDPEGMMLGEWGDAFGSQAIDLWFPSWPKEFRDLERAVYSVPQALWSCVVDTDPARATRAFACGAQLFLITRGLLGTLADVPAFAAHVQALAALKGRCADRLAFGRFRGDAGLEVKVDGPAGAAVMQSPAGPAIVIASPGGTSKTHVTIDRLRIGAGEHAGGKVHRLNGSTNAATGDELKLELESNEAVVWYP
jgi:hypothetical protein